MGSPKTLLLVEDDFLFAVSEARTLERRGYRIIPASTGECAIDAVDKDGTIDLILMDIDLGDGMDGAEAAEIILKKHDLPVLFLSSHFENEIVAKTARIQNYGYVIKGTVITVLDALIHRAYQSFSLKGHEAGRMHISLA